MHTLHKKLKKTSTVSKIAIGSSALLVTYLIAQFLTSSYYLLQGQKLTKSSFTKKTTIGNKINAPLTLFISGDSVGAGVGASTFYQSVSGRVANHLANERYVYFQNESVSGSRMEDMHNRPLPDSKQDIIILIISSNDLFHFTSLDLFAKQTEEVLATYSAYTDKLILVGPGRVFDGESVPFFLRAVYKQQSTKYVQVMESLAEQNPKVIYINPTSPGFYKDSSGPTTAQDKFHPNDEGHRLWFELIKPAL